MKKNNLKKVFAALAVSAVAVSATSVAASASEYTDSIRTGAANEEIAYNPNAYTTSSEYMSPDGATITPTIKIDKVKLTLAEAKEKYIDASKPVALNFNVSGSEGKYGSVGIHFVYDQRLTLKNITNPTSTVDPDTGETLYN